MHSAASSARPTERRWSRRACPSSRTLGEAVAHGGRLDRRLAGQRRDADGLAGTLRLDGGEDDTDCGEGDAGQLHAPSGARRRRCRRRTGTRALVALIGATMLIVPMASAL